MCGLTVGSVLQQCVCLQVGHHLAGRGSSALPPLRAMRRRAHLPPPRWPRPPSLIHQVLDISATCVKTSPVVLRFHQALKAGEDYQVGGCVGAAIHCISCRGRQILHSASWCHSHGAAARGGGVCKQNKCGLEGRCWPKPSAASPPCPQDDAWVQWQRQHACEPPPPTEPSEAVMLGGVVIRGPGGPSPGSFGRSSFGGGGSYRSPAAGAGGYSGGGGARAGDVCYRCRQPGHW